MRTFEAINKKKFPEPRPKLCKHCGSQFFPRTTFQSWCSSECGYEIAKKKKEKKDKEQKSKDRKELKEMKIETHSKEFKAEFKDKLYNPENHLQPTDEEKLKQVKQYAQEHKLDFDGEYLYAFRNHDLWGRGVFNKSIFYTKGKQYHV